MSDVTKEELVLVDNTEDMEPSNRHRRDFLNCLSQLGVAASLSALIPKTASASEPFDQSALEGRTSLAAGHRHTYQAVLHPDGSIVGATNVVQGHFHSINTRVDQLATDLAGVPSHSHHLEPEVRIADADKVWGDALEIQGGPFDPSATLLTITDPDNNSLDLPIIEVSPTSILSGVTPLRDQLQDQPIPLEATLEVSTVVAMSRPVKLRISPPVARPNLEEALRDLREALEEEKLAIDGIAMTLDERIVTFPEQLDVDAQRRLDGLRIAFLKAEAEFEQAFRSIDEGIADSTGTEGGATERQTVALLTTAARTTAERLVAMTEALREAPRVKELETIITCVLEAVATIAIAIILLSSIVRICLALLKIPLIGKILCALFLLVMVTRLVFVIRLIINFIQKHIVKLRDP